MKENIGIRIKNKDKMAVCVKIIRKYTKQSISEIREKIENDRYIFEGSYVEDNDIKKVLKMHKELQCNGIEVELYEHDKVASVKFFKNLINMYSEINYDIEEIVDKELD